MTSHERPPAAFTPGDLTPGREGVREDGDCAIVGSVTRSGLAGISAGGPVPPPFGR